MHYGGGTPTFFNVDQLTRLWELIESNFNFSDDAELSIEVDPRTMQPGQPELLFKQGFRRASLGIQDFNPQVQKAVDLVKPGGILYWRQNPGIGDHPWKGVEEIQFFPWTFELNYEWAKKYGCEVLECKWDAQSDRIYSEWKKL